MLTTIKYERLVIGYHGCDRSVGEDVLLNDGKLRPSDNNWDWLGKGVYFWEHGPARAFEWAQDSARRNKIAEPFVLGAFIQLGRCLDLTDTAAIEVVAGWYKDLADALASAGQVLPTNKPLNKADADLLLRDLDCAVLNFGLSNADAMDPNRSFQTVRGVFTEGGPAFPGAGIQAKTHVQVAVRNPGCILGYFKPA